MRGTYTDALADLNLGTEPIQGDRGRPRIEVW
jgi:hypothetical protein